MSSVQPIGLSKKDSYIQHELCDVEQVDNSSSKIAELSLSVISAKTLGKTDTQTPISEENLLNVQVLKGKDVLPYMQKIAQLRLLIFQEYPYLYKGDIATERAYLKLYHDKKDAIWVILKDYNEVVGVVMGIPLVDSFQEYKSIFLKKSINIESVFYLGDIILKKEYRRKGMGAKLYGEFERVINSTNRYEKISFRAVSINPNDPRKPDDYHNLDHFWKKRGYKRCEDMIFVDAWKEIGEEIEEEHKTVFSIKNLN